MRPSHSRSSCRSAGNASGRNFIKLGTEGFRVAFSSANREESLILRQLYLGWVAGVGAALGETPGLPIGPAPATPPPQPSSSSDD